jgi:site-specific recombinase XerD
MDTPIQVTRTVQVVVRHSADCKDRTKGTEWRRCKCPKSIVVYDGATKKNQRISAKTRSWETAEKFATDYRDHLDPVKQENKRLRAAEQQKQMPIEKAVELYLTDMTARLGSNSTVSGARHLLEHALCDWLAMLPPAERAAYVSDITPAHLIAWRASWKLSDLTAAIRWSSVRTFFSFCEGQAWVSDSPARRIRAPKAEHGGHTAIFSDEECGAILKAAHGQREAAFVNLLRWGGMAMSDAVQFRTEMLDAEGVLRYRRHKTNEIATVPLPPHVATLLLDVPLESNSVGPAQPFRSKNTVIKSDVRSWQRDLGRVFARAGIASVQTESGKTRAPHPHMFRDTCAVSALRHGAALHTVSRMLGHSNITTTQTAYMPFCKELERAQIEDARAAQLAAQPKPPSRGRKIVNIVENR